MINKGGRPAKLFDPNDKATNSWLNAQTVNTKRSYSVQWRLVLKWANMNGDEILESRKADKDNLWEQKTLQLKQWAIAQGLSDLYARQITVALRAFFAYNRCELKVTRQEAGKLRQGRRKTEDYRFLTEDLKRMNEVGDVREKYVLTVGKSLGLRAEDFLELKRGHFDAIDLTQPAPIFLGIIGTHKEGVNAYCFLDSDAVPVVKAMLAKMDREGRTNANDRMLTYSREDELTRALQRLAKEIGLQHGNKRVRFHSLRKFLTDRLSSHMSESKWKQVVGKQISESAYISPDSLREDYARAMPETVFIKSEDERERQIENAVQIALSSGLPPARVAEMRKLWRETMLSPEAMAMEINRERKQAQTEAGGLSFEQQGAQAIARMFRMAMEELRSEQVSS